jgi:hypothetical protein
MKIKRFPRPRLQRAFVLWFNDNHTLFKIPLRLTKLSAKGVELHFQNFPDCLSVWLALDELRVFVEWQGEPWDTLFDMDLYPSRTSDGYKCDQCMRDEGESVALFPTRVALWQDHLFAPFLKWVNEKLYSARWLRISCLGPAGDRGCTWAELIHDESELSKPDRTLLLMQQLKHVDGQPAHEGGAEGVTNWVIPLKPEAI